MYYQLLCSALLVGVAAVDDAAAVSTEHQKKKTTINLRDLQATRPPKTTPAPVEATRPPRTPPPTYDFTRLPITPPPTDDTPVTSPPTVAPAPAPQTIAQTVCAPNNTDFFTLCSLLEITGLFDILNGDGTCTLFAADNDAINKLTSITDLTDEEIMGLLMYHVAPNILTYNDLMRVAQVETMVPGLPIDVSLSTDDEVLLNEKVKITAPDILATNGIIQVIDAIIIPQFDSPTATPVTPEPTLKPTEVVTPEPTLKPTEAVTPEPTLKPTEVVTGPTQEPSSKPPTSDITSKSPTPSPHSGSGWGGGSKPSKDTPAPTNPVSLINNIGTSAPTGEKWVHFSKAGKSGSKTAKTGGKSSKHSSKAGKSAKVEGKTGKGSTPGYHAMEEVSVQEATGDVDGRLNARFRADWNASSQLRGSTYVTMMTLAVLTAAAAWCLHN